MREIVATFAREPDKRWSVVIDAAAEYYAAVAATPEQAFKLAMVDVRNHPSYPMEAA